MLSLDAQSPVPDSVPWCSAFVNLVCWLLRLQRSKSLAARSWLNVGTPVALSDARPGFDVVVLKRGTNDGPDVIQAPGHVGFFAGWEDAGASVVVLGGNQGDKVSLARMPAERILRICRLA